MFTKVDKNLNSYESLGINKVNACSNWGLKVGLLLRQNAQIIDLTYFTKDGHHKKTIMLWKRVCQFKFLVAYGEKSFKFIQIIQIILYLLFVWFITICEIYFPSLREQFKEVAYATHPRPLVLRKAHSSLQLPMVRTNGRCAKRNHSFWTPSFLFPYCSAIFPPYGIFSSNCCNYHRKILFLLSYYI